MRNNYFILGLYHKELNAHELPGHAIDQIQDCDVSDGHDAIHVRFADPMYSTDKAIGLRLAVRGDVLWEQFTFVTTWLGYSSQPHHQF